MAKATISQIPPKLYDLLAELSPDERLRAVQATLLLFGDHSAVDAVAEPKRGLQSSQSKLGAQKVGSAAFVNDKDPQNKGELLAVAARFREQVQEEESHSKADLKKVVTDAHRNFDDKNFTRDINNVKRQAAFFVLGGDRDSHKLSYYGKQYVDALPDRDAAARIKKPRIGGVGKRAAKKSKTTNKTSEKK